jgi:hypothetical protein
MPRTIAFPEFHFSFLSRTKRHDRAVAMPSGRIMRIAHTCGLTLFTRDSARLMAVLRWVTAYELSPTPLPLISFSALKCHTILRHLIPAADPSQAGPTAASSPRNQRWESLGSVCVILKR